ncbi:MAG TPA: hypothetical protein VN922_04200, partial [Bacteroidia bacterium]|nr:hypothetical protein [Bacteroidia bacterium]
MKKQNLETFKKTVSLGAFLAFAAISNAQWTSPTWNSANTAAEWTNGTVGIQSSAITTGASLDLGASLAIRGGNVIYNSSNAYVNWGSGSGNLYFRSLPTQGIISTYNSLMTITYSGLVGIGTTSPVQKLDVNGADAGGTIGIFRNGTYEVFLTAKMLGSGYNWNTQANDNGLIWSDGLGGSGQNSASGFVIAPWQGSNIGIRIDGSSGNFTVNRGTTVSVLGSCGESASLGYGSSYIGFNASRASAGWTANG